MKFFFFSFETLKYRCTVVIVAACYIQCLCADSALIARSYYIIIVVCTCVCVCVLVRFFTLPVNTLEYNYSKCEDHNHV